LRAAFRSRRSRLNEGDDHVLNKKRGKKYKTRKGCKKYRKPVGRMESMIFIASRTSTDVNPAILTYIADREIPVAALIVARKVVSEKPVVALIVARKLLVPTTPVASPIFSPSLPAASVDIKIGKIGWTVRFSGTLCITFLAKDERTSVGGAKAKFVKANVDISRRESRFIGKAFLGKRLALKVMITITCIEET